MLIKQQLSCFFNHPLVKKQEKKKNNHACAESFLKARISVKYGVLVKNHQRAMLDILTSYDEGLQKR